MIEGGMRKKLAAGMRLVASYKKVAHSAEVVTGEDGGLQFRLSDGRTFRSPSAAASAVMGGIAANGWRWWSLETAEPATAAGGASEAAPAATQRPDEAGAKPRPTCVRCGKRFAAAAQLSHHEANAERLCTPR